MQTDQSLFFYLAFAEAVNVPVYAALNDRNCVFSAFHFVNDSLFALQRLIHRKEVGHFVKNVLGQLAYVLVAVVCRVVKRDSDYLVVQRAVVQH